MLVKLLQMIWGYMQSSLPSQVLGDLKFSPDSREVLARCGGFKIFHTFGGDKGQSLLKFVYLLQVQLNFSSENLFSEYLYNLDL